MGRSCDCCGDEYGCRNTAYDTIICENCTEPNFTGDHVSVIYIWWRDELKLGKPLYSDNILCDYNYFDNSDSCPFIDSPFNIRLGVSPITEKAGPDSIWSNEATSESLLKHTKIGTTGPFRDTFGCCADPVCKCILPSFYDPIAELEKTEFCYSDEETAENICDDRLRNFFRPYIPTDSGYPVIISTLSECEDRGGKFISEDCFSVKEKKEATLYFAVYSELNEETGEIVKKYIPITDIDQNLLDTSEFIVYNDSILPAVFGPLTSIVEVPPIETKEYVGDFCFYPDILSRGPQYKECNGVVNFVQIINEVQNIEGVDINELITGTQTIPFNGASAGCVGPITSEPPTRDDGEQLAIVLAGEAENLLRQQIHDTGGSVACTTGEPLIIAYRSTAYCKPIAEGSIGIAQEASFFVLRDQDFPSFDTACGTTYQNVSFVNFISVDRYQENYSFENFKAFESMYDQGKILVDSKYRLEKISPNLSETFVSIERDPYLDLNIDIGPFANGFNSYGPLPLFFERGKLKEQPATLTWDEAYDYTGLSRAAYFSKGVPFSIHELKFSFYEKESLSPTATGDSGYTEFEEFEALCFDPVCKCILPEYYAAEIDLDSKRFYSNTCYELIDESGQRYKEIDENHPVILDCENRIRDVFRPYVKEYSGYPIVSSTYSACKRVGGQFIYDDDCTIDGADGAIFTAEFFVYRPIFQPAPLAFGVMPSNVTSVYLASEFDIFRTPDGDTPNKDLFIVKTDQKVFGPAIKVEVAAPITTSEPVGEFCFYPLFDPRDPMQYNVCIATFNGGVVSVNNDGLGDAGEFISGTQKLPLGSVAADCGGPHGIASGCEDGEGLARAFAAEAEAIANQLISNTDAVAFGDDCVVGPSYVLTTCTPVRYCNYIASAVAGIPTTGAVFELLLNGERLEFVNSTFSVQAGRTIIDSIGPQPASCTYDNVSRVNFVAVQEYEDFNYDIHADSEYVRLDRSKIPGLSEHVWSVDFQVEVFPDAFDTSTLGPLPENVEKWGDLYEVFAQQTAYYSKDIPFKIKREVFSIPYRNLSKTFDPSKSTPIELKTSPMKLSTTIVASSQQALDAFKDIVNNDEWYSYDSDDVGCENFCGDDNMLDFIGKKQELRKAIQNEENLIVYDREIFMQSLKKCCDVLNNVNFYEEINFRYSSDLANVFDTGLSREVEERPYYVSLFLEKNENFNGMVHQDHYLLDYNDKTEKYPAGHFKKSSSVSTGGSNIKDPAWQVGSSPSDGRNYFGVSPDFFYGYSLPLPSEEYTTRRATFEKSHWQSNIVAPYADECCQQPWQKTQSITLTFPQVDTSVTSFIDSVWGFSPDDEADPSRSSASSFLVWARLPLEIRNDPNFGGWKPIDHWFNTQSVETLNIINKPIKLTQIKDDQSQIIFSDYKTTHYTKQQSDYFDPIWVRTKNGFFDPFNPNQFEPAINNELWFDDTDKRNKVFNAISESNGDFGDFLWKLMVSPDDNGLEVNIYDAFNDITFEYQPNWITDDEIADGLTDPIFKHKTSGYYSYFYEKAGTVPISNKLYISKLPVARSSLPRYLRQLIPSGGSPWYFWLLISPATSRQYLPKSVDGQLGGQSRLAHDHMAIPKSHKQRFNSITAGVPVWTRLPLTDPREPTPLFWEDPTGGQEMSSGFEYPMCITYGFSVCNLDTESFFTEIFEMVNRFGGTNTKTEGGFTKSTSGKTVAATPYIYAIDSVDGTRSLDKKEIYKRDMQLEFSGIGPSPQGVPYPLDFDSWLEGTPEIWQTLYSGNFFGPFVDEAVYDLGSSSPINMWGVSGQKIGTNDRSDKMRVLNFGPAISSYENVTVEIKISDE